MKRSFQDLPGWTFEIEEVSANVYEIIGKDSVGHRVQLKGSDLDALLADARLSASKIRKASPRGPMDA